MARRHAPGPGTGGTSRRRMASGQKRAADLLLSASADQADPRARTAWRAPDGLTDSRPAVRLRLSEPRRGRRGKGPAGRRPSCPRRPTSTENSSSTSTRCRWASRPPCRGLSCASCGVSSPPRRPRWGSSSAQCPSPWTASTAGPGERVGYAIHSHSERPVS